MVRNEGATPGATPRQRPVNGGATHTPYTPSVAPALGGWVHAANGGRHLVPMPRFLSVGRVAVRGYSFALRKASGSLPPSACMASVIPAPTSPQISLAAFSLSFAKKYRPVRSCQAFAFAKASYFSMLSIANNTASISFSLSSPTSRSSSFEIINDSVGRWKELIFAFCSADSGGTFLGSYKPIRFDLSRSSARIAPLTNVRRASSSRSCWRSASLELARSVKITPPKPAIPTSKLTIPDWKSFKNSYVEYSMRGRLA